MRAEQEIRDRIADIRKRRGEAEWAGEDRRASDAFIGETMLLWALGGDDS